MRNIKYVFILFIAALSLNGCKEDDDFPVPPASTVPKFSYTIDNDGFAPATAVFTNESIVPENAGSATFTWNFGDGNSSVEENPTHVYEEPGAYTVNLVAVTSSSLEIKQVSKTIVVKDPNETGTRVYFTDGGAVYAALASEQIETPIFTPLAGVSMQSSYGMTVDTVSNKLYISDYGANAIYRSDLDGGNFVIFRSGVDSPNAMRIDYQENEIYWDTGNGIQKASLDVEDQSQREDFVTGQPNDPDGVAIDLTNRTLYWVNYNGGLWRKNLDGTGETELNPAVEGGSIIVVNDRIYYDEYVDTGDIRLKSANLDGGDVTTLATNISRVVYGLAYEAASNKIYWGDRNPGTIMRANLDGSEAEAWYIQPDSSPRGISFGKEI
ncbi:PKD domain-containing protein [Cryomorpha ignava]|uniref:PKD domain-containing protein n=1 Tax=Cryomorpha ignava TaxID=101383 RepID=A0A7K3WNH1_9FLAO|nr:PKD domain-containing protein [Cryomorpha ignava]NEN23203.1 PKD domain-containing protein [Cryomorpha ignava]